MKELTREGFRLSSQQKRLWSSEQNSATGIVQCSVLIEGPLNPAVLKQAVQSIVDRYEILRTGLESRAGIKLPFQVVAETIHLLWEADDWTQPPSLRQDGQIDALFQDQQGRAPDLAATATPWFSLTALSSDRHVLVMRLSAFCADSVTLDNLLGEISRSYEACMTHEEQNGEVLQYLDYCAWIEETIDSADEDVVSGKEYWHTQSELPALTFKLPFQSRNARSRPGAHKSFVSILSADTAAALENAAQQFGASPSGFLYACWLILLCRLGSQREIVCGVEFPGRSYKELRETLGLFAQWLPIRAEVSENDPFSWFLAEVSAALGNAEKSQDYYLDSSGFDRIGIGFGYEEKPPEEHAAGVSFSIIEKRTSTGRFDLQLRCVRTSDSLRAHFYYDSDVFTAGDIERLAGQFQTLLESAIRHPEMKVNQLQMLTSIERDQILIAFNDTGSKLSRTGRSSAETILARFQQQAVERPDGIAVVYENEQLTYGELEARSSQLAGYLQSLGVGPDTLVAICVERSLDIVLALLGVLKAGGAYVPLDGGLPKERLSIILNDTRASIVLTQRRAAEGLPEYDGRIVCLDTDWPAISRHDSSGSTARGPIGANLAYILFTSGSTGVPKGVAIEHRQLLNYVDAILEQLNLPPGASYAFVSTFAADLGNTTIFPALCSGGALHIVSKERASDPDALAQYFSQHSIDCLKIVPSHLEALLTAARPENVLPKRRLVLGGEAATWELLKRVEELAPHCVVLNHYGPTEATVGSATWRAAVDLADQRATSVPIGKPIANAKIYLLDAYLQPVPIWMPGEIHIGGAGVARGYLNRPDLTAERFIPSPFEPGERLYRTGDLGRYLSDGSIEFLGRTDHQVKIRGFRIELGEIEAVLRQLQSIKQAVAVVREDNSGEKRIVAYVVTHHGKVESPDSFRDFLKTRLPDYMVPSAFVTLDALPLTSNGKLDRARLPEPARPGAVVEKPAKGLLKPLEVVLAGIFAEILHIENVAIDSNFFDLGGHSLLAIQVLSRVRRVLNIDLPVRALFETPTVAGMAAAILADPVNSGRIEKTAEQLQSAPQEQSVPIARRKDRDFVPLSPTQEQMWFMDQLAPGSVSYNMPQAFHLRGTLHLSPLERSLNEIVRRHESLRTTFASIEGVPLQVIASSVNVALPVVELFHMSNEVKAVEAARVRVEEARQSFDLAQGPLLRFRLLRLGREEHTLLITMHHIISDGWSWGIFLKELSVLYEAYCAEKTSPLSELAIQYADFTQWQRERLKQETAEDRLSFWTRQLDHAPTLLELPTDRPRGAVQSFLGATHSEMFPLALKEKLGALAREEGATLFMTMCAAFNALLFRWTGQKDILVGSTIAGRDRAELETLIGLFINTLVLRTDLSGQPTFRELLRRVREVALEAYANQEVPFDKLMKRLHSKRSLSHGTLFQVLFLLHQGTSEHDLALSGLEVARIPVQTGMVKFALTVSVVEKADGLNCSFLYQTDLFDPSTIRRMVAQFQTLLYGIVADPDARLTDLPVLSNAEYVDAVVTWNSTTKDYPLDKCVHDLFQEQASRTPDATAVLFEDGRLNYRELDRKSNLLARHLQDKGVYRGTLVVVLMERSLDMIVALMAILKAGGAYVPLDPKHSVERLTWVIRDTGAPVLVTNQHVIGTLKGLAKDSIDIVCPDDPTIFARGDLPESRRVRLSADDLAYVIYTSGSTGTPKGVEITHGSLMNFAVYAAREFDLQPSDRVLQFASLSFDTAIEEIFPCLIQGATLVLRTDRMVESASVFLQQCRQWRITVLDLPTVYWHELTENIASQDLTLPDTLRLVILGGDKAAPERVAQWQTCSKGRVRLLNEYGPTETTVVATTHELTRFSSENGLSREAPIGRPIANVQTYILDPDLNPVPIGVCGELHIGGAGLAKGYRCRPDLTAESFIPNPFSDAGGRLYKTGDLARYLPDGAIDFLGRLDHQVKVRGFRVEPAEVETVLTENPLVRQVVVVTQPLMSGDNRLVAYVVLAPGSAPGAQVLSGFLKTRLPEYMMPSAFVFLDALPLTSSGKVDRRALPAPDQSRLESSGAFIAARTPLEQQLVDEWERLLGARPIGVRDNFFDLGGHSLLGVRLIARIEKRFGRNLPVAVLFESPTIEQLALLLEQEALPECWPSLISVQPKGSKPPFFWVHGDSSNASLPAYLGADQPVYGLEHQSMDGRRALYTQVDEIARHYVSEMRTVRPHGPYLLGGYSFGAVLAFEMAHQLRGEGEEVALLFMLDPPGKLKIEESTATMSEEVQGHLRNIGPLKHREKMSYVLTRIEATMRDHFNTKMDQMTRRLRKLRLKGYISEGRLLPASLRSGYILSVYALALRSYVPQQYSGAVTIMKVGQGSYQPRLDWVKLITGDLETHEMNGAHMDLRTEPYVGVWARRMKESLNRVQESLRTRDLYRRESIRL